MSYQVNCETQAQDLIAIRDTKDRTGPVLGSPPDVAAVRPAGTSASGAVAILAGKRPEVLVIRLQGRL